jgi:hypothetical protein
MDRALAVRADAIKAWEQIAQALACSVDPTDVQGSPRARCNASMMDLPGGFCTTSESSKVSKIADGLSAPLETANPPEFLLC